MPKPNIEVAMLRNLDTNEGLLSALTLMNESFSESLRSLLESKHLYQNVSLNYDEIMQDVRSKVVAAYHPGFDGIIARLKTKDLIVTTTRQFEQGQTPRLLQKVQHREYQTLLQ